MGEMFSEQLNKHNTWNIVETQYMGLNKWYKEMILNSHKKGKHFNELELLGEKKSYKNSNDRVRLFPSAL